MWNKVAERRIKVSIIVVAVLVCLLYILNKGILYHQFDNSYPTIAFEKELLEVSVDVTEEQLLTGASAFDAKDGDVTDSIIIESMSNMLEGNERIVTYAAFDEDNHVGKSERRIRYIDYEPIRFSMEEPIDSTDWSVDLSEMLAPLKVTDCIDGDLSSEIVVVDSRSESVSAEEQIIYYTVQVTNSAGEIATVEVPIRMMSDGSARQKGNASIVLEKYLDYCKAGEELNLSSYIESATIKDELIDPEYVAITGEVDTKTPGSYVVTYSISQDPETVGGFYPLTNEIYASCDLIIVVEE